MTGSSTTGGEGYAGLETWVRLQMRLVMRGYPGLTTRGWEPSSEKVSAIEVLPAEDVSNLHAELRSDAAIADAIASFVALSVNRIPDREGSMWLVQQVERLHGRPVCLGAAIAAAIILGYEPIPWKCGGHCLFRRRLTP